jgi:hypothetical protein
LQLKKRKGVRESLARISAGLLSATIPAIAQSAMAQDAYGYGYGYDSRNDNFGPGFAYTELNSALLVYQESGSRVGAIEPTLDLSINGADGRQLQIGMVADAVSGATPNGAVPSQTQDFLTPIKVQGSSATVTSASGGSTIVHLPPTPGQLAAASLGRQYTVAANTLPVDQGFRDHRGALTFGWTQPLGSITGIGFGGGYSRESDYSSITGNTHIDQTFNAGNTTLSLNLNTELDSSFPFGGIPQPMTVMNAQWKTPTSRGKTQVGFVAGLTEVMSRRWLMQLNYAFDQQSGYQNDPYRIISAVDASSGLPLRSLYENRPGNRQSHSIYWDNRFDLDPAITDLSLRYFTDSWGITSETADLSERLNLGSNYYIEPSARWYKQTAATFFHNYLVDGTTLPTYATSDTRLGAFTATTFAVKLGFILSKRTELYLRAEYYQQSGNGHPADAIGQLKQQNLFAGTKASVAFIGYKWDFH